jgi:hypothetical protein
MSASGSDGPRESTENTPYAENDDRETQLGYGEGGVPLYVAFLWVAFIAAYLIVMFTLMLPDYTAWASR